MQLFHPSQLCRLNHHGAQFSQAVKINRHVEKLLQDTILKDRRSGRL